MNPSLLLIPDRYKAAKLYSQIPDSGAGDFLVTRGTTATRVNASGLIESVASGVPRIDYTGGGCGKLLVEPAATNSIRNNTMVGAVTGTPGTLPTNYSETLAGLTREVVDTGVENGIEYVDIRVSGTATGTLADMRPESTTQIVASNGQAWSSSVYLKQIAQPLPPVRTRQVIYERTLAGAFVSSGESPDITLTSLLSRSSFTRTLSGGINTERVQPAMLFTLVSGSTYDFTIRIGLPQMELGAVATSVIKTSTVAVTRNADVISLSSASGLIGQTEGTVYAQVNIDRSVIGTIAVIAGDNTFNFLSIAKLATRQIRIQIRNGGGSIISIITSSPLELGLRKIALGYTNGDYALFIDGVLAGTSTNNTNYPALPLTRLFLSDINFGFLNDTYLSIGIYKEKLLNAELAQLTTL